MWAQVLECVTSGTSYANQINIASSGVFINDIKDYWVIVNPFTTSSELRKIDNVSIISGIISLNLSINLVNTPPLSGANVFIQTSPIWDIRLFSADPDLTISTAANNTTAINAAVADCQVNGGGMIAIPSGIYILDPMSTVNAYIDIQSKSNIQFIGEGEDISILMINSTTVSTNTSMFLADNAENISWENLTLNGSEREHVSCLTTGNDGGKQFSFENVKILSFKEKAIWVYNVLGLKILYCQINNNLQEGIYIYGASKDIWIENNRLIWNSVEDIYFDAGSATTPIGNIENVIITGNEFTRGSTYIALKIVSTYNNGVSARFTINENTFNAARVIFENCTELIFSNNILYSGHYTTSPLVASKTLSKISINNNIIIQLIQTGTANAPAIDIQSSVISSNYYLAKTIVILGNDIFNGNCYFKNIHNLNYKGNKIRRQNAYDDSGFVVAIDEDPINFGVLDYGNLTVIGNECNDVYNSGIDISSTNSSYKFDLILIDGNIIQGYNLERGIFIQPPGTGTNEYWNKAIVAFSNTVDNVYDGSPGLNIDVFGSYLTEYNPFEEIWIANGIPNNLLTAPQGSLSLDKTIAADNNYSKDTLTGSEGWELTSEMGKQLLFKTIFNDNLYATFPPGNLTAISTTDGDIPKQDIFISGTPPSPWNPALDSVSQPVGNCIVDTVISPTVYEAFANSVYMAAGSPDLSYNNKAIALVDTTKDGELKAIFRFDAAAASGSNVYRGGIVFRYQDDGRRFEYYFELAGGGYNLNLDVLDLSTNLMLTIMSFPGLSIGNADRVVLKVMLHGAYISIFFNDLLMYSMKDDDAYIDAARHGLVFYDDTGAGTTANIFFCQTFKHLIP